MYAFTAVDHLLGVFRTPKGRHCDAEDTRGTVIGVMEEEGMGERGYSDLLSLLRFSGVALLRLLRSTPVVGVPAASGTRTIVHASHTLKTHRGKLCYTYHPLVGLGGKGALVDGVISSRRVSYTLFT